MIYIGEARAARLFVTRACTLMTGADIAHISRGSKLKLKWIHIVNRFPFRAEHTMRARIPSICVFTVRCVRTCPSRRARDHRYLAAAVSNCDACSSHWRIYRTIRVFPHFPIKQASLSSYKIQGLKIYHILQ